MLNFIAYAEPKLEIPELREALSVPDTVTAGQVLDPHSIIREDSIPKLCKSLVRRSNDGGHYEFAHFTVQEFLEGQMNSMPELKPFRISKSICNRLLAIQCLNYLQFKDFDHWPTNHADEPNYIIRRNEEHPFYKYAARFWPIYARDEWTDQSLIGSAIRFFNPMKTGNLISWALQLLDDILLENRNLDREGTRARIMRLAPQLAHRSFTPLHLAATLSLPVICSALLENGTDINQKSGFGTPLQCAAQGLLLGIENPDDLLLSLGFNPYCIGTDEKCHMTNTIKILLDAGADHNIPCSSPFSGQSLIAIAMRAADMTCDFTAISTLLEVGIDPDEEAQCVFDKATLGTSGRDYKIRAKNGLDLFVRCLAPITGRSTTHFSLCKAAWSLAIEKGCDFTSDTSIVDTRISLAEDALITTLFTSIRNADFQKLASVVGDPRSNLTAAINPVNGLSPFQEAAKLGYDNCLIAFKILLDAGCNVSQPGPDGLLPVHMLARQRDPWEVDDNDEKYNRLCEIIREFILRGTGCTVVTEQGQNVLHLGRSAPVFIKANLDLETEANVTAALETQDKEGYTPISFALAEDGEESALLLLQRAKCCPNILRGPIPILHLCVEMNSQRTFDILVGADIQSQAIGTNDATLLHHITSRTSANFLARLMFLHPKACTLRTDGRIPLDIYLNSCLCSPESRLDIEVLGILVTEASQELAVEDKKLVWENFMSTIQDARRELPVPPASLWLFIDESVRVKRDREIALDLAASQPDLFSFMQSYEEVTRISAVLPLLEPLGSTLRVLDDLWPISVATLQKFLTNTSKTFWNSLRESDMVVRLLKAAITAQNVKLVTLLLTEGVSVHQRTDHSSALELACSSPATEDDSQTIFAQLLEHADTSRLNESNPNVGQQKGLVHYLVGQSKEWQISELLKRGMDPNLRTIDDLSMPALAYHLQQQSVDTAQLLLENGANPNQTCSSGFNAALWATASGQTAFLSEMMASTAWKIAWQKTGDCHAMIRGQMQIFRGVNALHIAALVGKTECLSFYIDNGLFTDVNAPSTGLFTPMHMAAIFGSIDLLTFLCGRGADINAKAADGRLPLHLAVQNAQFNAVEYLVEHGSNMDTDNSGMNPMAYARGVGNQTIIDFLRNCSKIFTRVSQKDTKEVAGAFENAFLRADTETCEELLRQGFCLDSELPGLNGRTPLVWAIENHQKVAIEWLLAHNVDTTRCVGTGHIYVSPLHHMVECPELNEILSLMLDKYQRDGGSVLREKESMICAAVNGNNNTGLQLLLDHVRKFEAPHM